jgi:hypothetical protein
MFSCCGGKTCLYSLADNCILKCINKCANQTAAKRNHKTKWYETYHQNIPKININKHTMTHRRTKTKAIKQNNNIMLIFYKRATQTAVKTSHKTKWQETYSHNISNCQHQHKQTHRDEQRTTTKAVI